MQVSASTADLLKQQSGDRACDLFCQVLQVISNVRWSLKTTDLEYRSANDFHEGPDSKYFRLWEPGGLSCGLPWWRRQERICLPMQVLSLGLESPLEKGVATHSSILAWEIPWTVEPGRLQSLGLQRVRHNWVTNTFTGHCCNYSTMQPRGLYRPWNSSGQNTGVGNISLSRGSFQPRDWTQVSRTASGFFISWATREASWMQPQTIYGWMNAVLF